MSTRILFATLFVAAVLLVSGCADDMLSDNKFDATDGSEATTQRVPRTDAPYDADLKKLRHPQLLDRAQSAGKSNSETQVHMYLAFDEYEPDGITPRVLDQWGITRRILDDYGITRRILDDYGITRRVLDDYGITSRVLENYGITRRVLDDYGITARVLDQYQNAVTAELLAAYGLTFAMLEEQGITTRVLDDYGITRRVLDDYNMTDENLETLQEAFESVVHLRVRINKARPGIAITFSSDYLNVLLEEMLNDPDIEFLEPDAVVDGAPLYLREGLKKANQMVPWNLNRIGGVFTEYDKDEVHVFILDSGIYDRDLNVVEAKDFTMLFVNRDEETWDDEAFEHMPVYDPGTAGNPADETGHGTHVAGTIGAKNNDKGIKGVAPEAQIHSLKVLTAQGRTDITTVIAAVDYVTDWKQRFPLTPVVLNLSLGMDLGSTAYNVLDEAVKKATDFGVVVVVSAGNDGTDAATYSPAHVVEAITVGAYGQDDQFSEFSNHGPVVDILAPGDPVVSLTHLPAEAQEDENVLMSGTSFAAPHVAGAAALYLAQHPLASAAEVKQALINFAKPGIDNVPQQTTDRTVFVGEFAGDGLDKPFKITKHEWKDHNDKLLIEGEGPRLQPVDIYNKATGALIERVTIMEDGKWKLEQEDPDRVPCSVLIEFFGIVSQRVVENAPNGCDGPLAFDRAKWDAGKSKLEVKGFGPQGYDVELSDAGSGQHIVTMTIDNKGKFEFKEEDFPYAPCVVKVKFVDSPAFIESVVENAPSTCESVPPPSITPEFTEASWDKDFVKLRLFGIATPGTEVTLMSESSGTVLATSTSDSNGEFQITLTDPALVPCTARLETPNGEHDTANVLGAPNDCERPFQVETLKWKSGSTPELEFKGRGAYNGTFTLANGRTSEIFYTGTIENDGKIDVKIQNPSVIPCTVIAASEGRTLIQVVVPVEDATFNCDYQMSVTSFNWVPSHTRLEVGGVATGGSTLTLINPDNGAEIVSGTASVERQWRFDLDLSHSGGVPPCRVLVRAENGEATRTVNATCDPNFTYTAPPEGGPGQNPHSFINIDNASWNQGALIADGEGYVFMEVTLRNPYNGDVLGTTTVNQEEAWSLTVNDPWTIPCTIEAELDGRVETANVSNVAPSCDDKPFIHTAEWSNGAFTIEAEGGKLDQVFLNSEKEGYFGEAAFGSDGLLNLTLLPAELDWVPCTLLIVANEQFHQLSVDNAPASCDGKPVLHEAAWNNGALTIEGEGPFRGQTVITSKDTGRVLAEPTFAADGTLNLTMQPSDLPYVPCKVRLTMNGGVSNGKHEDMNVDGAPESCDGEPVIEEAEWSNGQLSIIAQGTFNGNTRLESKGTGDLLAEPVFNADGTMTLSLGVEALPYVPCKVKLVAVGGDADGKRSEMDVENAPASCDGAPFIHSAQWKDGALDVEAEGPSGITVTLSSAVLGTQVAQAIFDASGSLEESFSNLPLVPCTLRMTIPGGATYDLAVDDAPLSCDAQAYVAIDKAEWDSGKQLLKLEGEGMDIAASGNGTVQLRNAATGAILGEAELDGGDWEVDLSLTGPVPCTVEALLENGTTTRAVNNAPANCQ